MIATLLVAAAAFTECETLAVRGAAEAPACYREAARTARAPAERAEALWRAGDVAGANAAFRDAARSAPGDAAIRARWGGLYLDVHQQADAQTLFQEALALDPDDVQALLGMAELSLGRFEPGVRSYLSRVLRREPDHPAAHLLLARMRLELGDTEAARADLQRLVDARGFGGRQVLEAYALLAAADALDDVVRSPWVARALAMNPAYGDVHSIPAYYYVINRRYREAVDRYLEAVALEPESWDAQAELGINLLRVARPEEARRHLELAYRGDPYNPLTVNTLRLLDLLDGFAAIREPHLLVRAPRSQADVLYPYVQRLAARAGEEMATRYGYSPTGSVVVELYEHHDDFAVRTAGLPGLGILGATFGDVVVMDGPSARSIEDGFDWASALWHELAHVYTLGATDNRVSRWFSEGVSVMEEWDHGPTRQKAVPLGFLGALAEGRLLGVADLDEGFLRPRRPDQVAVSYVEAGLLCQFLAARHDSALSGMLAAYRRGADTTDAVRRALGIEPEALDAAFHSYLDQRFGAMLADLDGLRAATEQAQEAARKHDWSRAVEAGRRAVAAYPEYVQADGGYLPLLRAADALGDTELLNTTLEHYFAAGGRDPWALTRLAQRRADEGRADGEIEVRRALVRTTPLDGGEHTVLGDRLTAAGRSVEALSEYRAALALGPQDEAAARLRLAETYLALRRPAQARRSVLQALEIAPRYDAALELLLKIDGEGSPP